MNRWSFTNFISLQRLNCSFYLLFSFSFLSSVSTLQGQIQEPNLINPVPPSPNAAALGVYGNTPVSLYTGQANVSIPIHTIVQNDFSMPVSISYNSTGMKVEEIASNVGLGWALNAGGVVTRTVFGRNDFGANGYQSTPYDIPTDLSTSGTFIHTQEQFQRLWDFAKQNHDSEPDVFFFNFAGHTGKFVMDKEGNTHVIPHQKLRITRENGWKIVTDDGYTFQFSAAEHQQSKQYSLVNSVESSSDLETFVSSWYLTKITFPNSNLSIDLEYLPAMDLTTWYTGNFERKRIMDGTSGVDQNAVSYSLNAVQTVRLSRIIYESGEVAFEYGNMRCDLNGDKILQYIKIKDASGNLLRTFAFKYTYNGWSGSDAATVPSDCGNRLDVNLRLMLTEIAELDPTGRDFKPPYKFSYNEGNLPPRNSKAQDYWGYFNGASNATLIPDMIIPYLEMYTGFGTNRNPVFDYAKRGLLKKVEYPTGGYTTFEYEPNYVHPSEYVDLPAEAVRVPKVFAITTQDFSVNLETVEFPSGVDGDATFRFSGSISCGGCHYIRWTLLKKQPDGTFSEEWTAYDLTVPPGNGKISISKNDVFKIKHEILVSSPIYSPAMSPGYSLDFVWMGYQQTLTETGGVRISKITDFDPVTDLKHIRTFDYKRSDDDQPSGFILSMPKFYRDFYQELIAVERLDETEQNSYYNLTSTNNLPLTTTQGSHVGYSEVVEYTGIETPEDKFISNGKTVYKYWAPDLIPDKLPTRDNNYQQYFGFPYANIISQDWKRGLLKQQTTYSIVSGEFKEVRKVDNYYSFVDKGNPNANYSNVVGFKAGFAQKFYYHGEESALWNYVKFKWGYYRHESGYAVLDSVVEKTYDQHDVSKYAQTTTSYKYNLSNLKVAQEEFDAGTERRITINTYPVDYADGSGFIKEMVDANIITAPIEQVQIKAASDGSNKVVVGGQVYRYNSEGKGLLEEVKVLESKDPIPLSMFRFSNQQNAGLLPLSGGKFAFSPDSRFNHRVTYLYDEMSTKVLSVQTKEKAKYYLWGYDNTLPIAEAVNSSTGVNFHTSFEENGVSLEDGSGRNLARTGKKVNAGSFIFPVWLNNTSNLLMSYWYHDGNTWIFSGDLPFSPTISVPAGYKLDEIRAFSPGTLMTTYTYEQGKGVSSITDVNNETTYFEYDGFGRLETVRDNGGNIVKGHDYNYLLK